MPTFPWLVCKINRSWLLPGLKNGACMVDLAKNVVVIKKHNMMGEDNKKEQIKSLKASRPAQTA